MYSSNISAHFASDSGAVGVSKSFSHTVSDNSTFPISDTKSHHIPDCIANDGPHFPAYSFAQLSPYSCTYHCTHRCTYSPSMR